MTQTIARYAVTFGLSGCYMPDSHEGAHEFTSRRDLAEFIRGELRVFDLPMSLFGDVKIRNLCGLLFDTAPHPPISACTTSNLLSAFTG